MKKLAVLFVMTVFFGSFAYAEEVVAPSIAADATSVAEAASAKYFCPMDGFEADQAGKCEKCGMELLEKPSLDASTEDWDAVVEE